jgi:pyruvate dehydrogenase E2 component (dihydrolipoamide acetyltransferase)
MKVFTLPDLGEGLQEAEITEWHVTQNEAVEVDQPLLSVETAKAIVEIPSPYAGRIEKLFGKPGDLLQVGDLLVEFAEDAEQRVDAGTVVGRVETAPMAGRASGLAAERERTAASGGRGSLAQIKATPAVRALARRLEVDLSIVTPTGPNDTIMTRDV